MKDDICYLYNVFNKLNEKVDNLQSTTKIPKTSSYDSTYKKPINLDDLENNNKRSFFQRNTNLNLNIRKNLSYTPGQEIIFAYDSTHFFTSTVEYYDSKTGDIELNVQTVFGSGTYSFWEINLTGSQGPIGPTGDTGPTGESGDIYSTTSTNEIDLSSLSGTQTYTIGTGLSYTIGQEVTFGNSSTDYFDSIIDSYDSDTGIIVVEVQTVVGTGTFSFWEVNISGAPGVQGPTGPTGPEGSTPIQKYIDISGTYDYTTDSSLTRQSTIIVGSPVTGSVNITLPHWSIVGDTTVYYLYNQQVSNGIDMIVNAPNINGENPAQMIFQGNSTLINPADNKQLIIPPQGTATVVIQAQYYTVMNNPNVDNYYSIYGGSINLDFQPLDTWNTFIEAGLSYVKDQYIIIKYDENNYFTVQVESYDSSTGEIEGIVRRIVGLGSYNSWTINLSNKITISPSINEWYEDNGGVALDYTSTSFPTGSTYMYGNSVTTNSLNIILPHWTIVGDGTVYYFYNQNGSQNFILNAPNLTTPTGAQMIFQGTSSYIDDSDNKILTIPPNGSIVLVIIGQYYTSF